MHLLITAGPTHEPIDDVRYIGNRSSGRLGLAIAEASCQRHWRTTLLLGPTALPIPHLDGLETQRFQTTEELSQLLNSYWPSCDLLIMAAAVADYRLPTDSRPAKHARKPQGLDLHLEATPDLVAGLQRKKNQRVVGFALEEAANLVPRALEKLSKKKLDAIVANPLETMDALSITSQLFFSNGTHQLAPKQTKQAFAHWLLDELSDWLGASPVTGGDR